MTTLDRPSPKPQAEPKPDKAAYIAPRIEKSQKLVEVTGQVVSGFIPPG